ncbi:hypothetical protein BP6252_14028 [Coleophoma cylindrospora]|uniref:Transcription factor domain-containing protein n=1 Tax=Coleophoma cylindrospora TaxID=1849047 RepID=A0A3D8Q4U1_9HELO|nr:hypothetical protein BP6252_14028 [Coleophoma cylindrospora]
MSFQFIENSKIDTAARKRIRSHVMKGKNVGKMYERRTHRREEEVPSSGESHEGGTPIRSFFRGSQGQETNDVSVPRTIGNSFSTFTFPVQIQPYMRELLFDFISITADAVYPKEFCLPLDAKKSLLFEYLQTDEAFFHSSLAISQVCVDSFFDTQDSSPRVLQHMWNTYRCVSHDLQAKRTPSDPTIAAVLTMAICEDISNQPQRYKMHVDAVFRMVELRNGIAQFATNTVLVQKICRVDIEYALYKGSSPYFYRDEFPRQILQSASAQADHENNPSSMAYNTRISDPVLRCVVVDLMSISCLFNDDRMRFRLEPDAYQEVLISVSYRLLHRYPLAGDRADRNNDNACHIGLLALITTMIFKHGRHRQNPYDILTEKLRDAVKFTLDKESIDETGMASSSDEDVSSQT